MKFYKGIDLDKNKEIHSYIDTYHILDRDNYESYLEDDIPLQRLVKLHYTKKKIYIIIFNVIPYIILFIFLNKGA